MKKQLKLMCVLFMMLTAVMIAIPGRAEASTSLTPSISSITWRKSGVTISWTKSSKSSNYLLYRKTEKGTFKKIATVNNTYYKDTSVKAGRSYTYYVTNEYLGKNYKSKKKTFNTSIFSSTRAISCKRIYGSSKDKIQLKWNSGQGGIYAIMMKTGSGSYKKIKTLKTYNSSATYTVTKLSPKTRYKFQVKKTGSVKKSNTSSAKISGKATVTVKDQNNSNATITWKKLSGVSGYFIYRKIAGGKYRKIATVSSSVTTYKDVYCKTVTKAERSTMNKSGQTVISMQSCFVDPSYNPFAYVVRGYKKVNGKTIYSSYNSTGSVYLASPVITNVSKSGTSATITWSKVFGAAGYYIYEKNGSSWKRIGEKSQSSASSVTSLYGTLSTKVTCTSAATDFAVKAYQKPNGSKVSAKTFATFTIKNKKYSQKKIMFIGNSITYGTPYKGKNADIFSYPYLTGKLTGAEIYNVAIPGATLTYKSEATSDCLIDSCIDPTIKGADTTVTDSSRSYAARKNTNGYKLTDFDVIVINAGTNDFGYSRSIGSISDTEKTTFYGALNVVFTKIKAASEERVEMGKSPIKVVYMDLFHRAYGNSSVSRYSGDTNPAGKKLSDFQNAINAICEKYNSDSLKIYQMSTASYITSTSMNNGYTVYDPLKKTNLKAQNIHYSTTDNLHPTRLTYMKIASGLSSYMIKNNILE